MKFLTAAISFILFILPASFFAQPGKIDSLRAVIKNAKDSNAVMHACMSLSAEYNLKNFDENLVYGFRGLSIAKAKNDSVSIANFLHNIGTDYYLKGRYDSAANYYYKSAAILESKNELAGLASVYNNLAQLYRKIGPYSRSHEFYNKAMSLYRQLNDKGGISTIYNESGVLDEYEGNFEEAIKSYKASLDICKEMNNQQGIAYSLNFIAGAYAQMRKFKEAEDYNAQSLRIREQMKDSFAIALTYTDFGSIYNAEGKFDKAEENILKANEVAQALGYIDLLRNNFNELSAIEASKGDYKKSLDYFKQAAVLKDSIYKTETAKEVEELSVKFETAEKEKQIQQQQFEIKQRNYWIIAISVLLLLGSLLGYSNYHRYKLKQQAHLQAEIMKQQDQATKAVIEAEEKERKRIAGELHDGVGQMMSAAKMNLSAMKSNLPFASADQKNNFEKIESLIDESCLEVRTVSHNMMPNALLKAGLAAAVRTFIDKIDKHVIKINLYTEGLNERIDSNIETVLYRVVQECVNNVIKHANASLLDISLIKDNDGISVTIEDNGKGFDTSGITEFEGIGLKNIKSRIDFLKGTIEWNSAPGGGTLVAMHIPV
ncbi:tetratricopeptide repeat protein [Panacibacter ginsenosidivorans]|uniref:Oxygen sensor histidine kinase NreB n=1 Tax=Panacibacter ginsenosidivorans TaxID=1813871 RepID=A0A5B8V829_9BACT|nr:sensor histidine kinase [Panacibacter ginsenosidivorans]QEC67389.1 tetratricopeptide repeat protein [Panacibacter ginsenosidivorans]